MFPKLKWNLYSTLRYHGLLTTSWRCFVMWCSDREMVLKQAYLFLTCYSHRDERGKMKIPKDMDDAKALGTVLSKYKDTYYTQVLVAYFATYILYPLGSDWNGGRWQVTGFLWATKFVGVSIHSRKWWSAFWCESLGCLHCKRRASARLLPFRCVFLGWVGTFTIGIAHQGKAGTAGTRLMQLSLFFFFFCQNDSARFV